MIEQMTDPLMGDEFALVLTKLEPPTPPESMLTRPRLGRLLDEAHKRPVTLVRAPAGFGKSTAVADWIDRHDEIDRFAWLTVDAQDDEPHHFWARFVEAVRAVEPSALASLRQTRSGGTAAGGADFSTELVNGLCGIRQPITVVIDDLESISSPEVMSRLAFVINAMPPNVHLVLCSRSEPDLPLSTWRASGRLSEVGRNELRFNDREAGAYLDSLIAGAISEGQVKVLIDRAEGWIAALYLAALGIQHAPDPTEFLDGFDGGHYAIADYIVEEVLAGMPESIRSFILETSILVAMSPTACDAVTGRTDSEAMLKTLVRHGVFVASHGRSGRWSYHPLFREALQAQLAISVGVTGVAHLHARASRAYLDESDYATALHHAIAGKAFGLARTILGDHHRDIIITRPKVLAAALDAFPEESLALWPQGRLMQLVVATFLADSDSLRALAGREAIGGSRSLDAVARTLLSYLHGDRGQLEELLPRAARVLPADAGNALRGLVATVREQYESGATALQSTAGSPESESYASSALTGILAWNRVSAGYLNMGAALARRALSNAETDGTEWPHWVRWAELAQAQAKFDRGQLDDAQAEVRSIVEAHKLDGWCRVEANILAARIDWALGNRDAASQHFASASVSPTGPVSGDLAEKIALTQAEICVLDGDIELAAAWLPDWETRAAAGPTTEKARLVVARLLVEYARFDEALDLLEWAGTDSPRSIRYLVEAEKLKAIATSRSRDSSAPLVLEVALAMARTEGFVQTFVDDWRALTPISSPSDIAVISPVVADNRSISIRSSDAAAGAAVLVEPLTDRELAVLHLLPTRRTNQEIAEQLFISINTVKTHVKAIYRKLEVGSRNAAVDRAVSMRLV